MLRRLTAAIAISFQLIVMSSGALTACVDRPHTHGGIPAPDCVMHHEGSHHSHGSHQPATAPAASEHHHGEHHSPAHTASPGADSNAAPDMPQITCGCSSDPMAFLIGDGAALPDVFGIPAETIAAAMPSFALAPIDFQVAPALRPPRALPS